MSDRVSHLWSIKRFTLRSKWRLCRFIFRHATSFKVVIGGYARQQKTQSTLHQLYMIRKDREMWQAQNHGFSSRSHRLTSFSSKFMSGTVWIPLSFCPTIWCYCERTVSLDSKNYLSGLPRLRINVWAYLEEFFGTFYCSAERSACMKVLSVAMLKCWNRT